MGAQLKDRPNWDQLYEIAASQEGYFTTKQAAQAGYSPPLLAHHTNADRMLHIRRGIYRLVHFPAGDHEELVVVWLWADREGVFSHQTALNLLGLSDVLPSRLHLTLPASWKRRRLRVLEGTVLHHADVAKADRSWIGSVPITSPARTLRDCTEAQLSPDLLRQALDQAIGRGVVGKREVEQIENALQPFEEKAG